MSKLIVFIGIYLLLCHYCVSFTAENGIFNFPPFLRVWPAHLWKRFGGGWGTV